MTRPGLGSGSATVAGSFHQLVELRPPRLHFGARHRVDDDAGRIPRPMAPLRGGHEPVVMVGRQQDELSAPVPGDLDRLASRHVLKLREFTLELDGRRLRYDRLEYAKSEYPIFPDFQRLGKVRFAVMSRADWRLTFDIR